MESTRRGLKELEQRIDRERSWNCTSIDVNLRNRVPTTLNRTRVLLEQAAQNQHKITSPRRELKRVATDLGSAQRLPELVKSGRSKNSVGYLPGQIVTTSSQLLESTRIYPAVESAGRSLQKYSFKVTYTLNVQTLLYMAEFLLLLNYVEVVIPLVFSIYMVTYQLPNREYYAQLHGMTQGELIQTLENVMFYCVLQIVSLLLLVFVLQRKLGLSQMNQLAFVLEKQYSGVQTRLVFWVIYNAQASLQHYGTLETHF
ncbi:hypothetical protein JG687_00018727 [Phytophthora cactorum]|uniref:Uncharacterized protein n=3 Tax=Phytophthora cactorum TaxID=29920 RepID=A0A8T1TK44_9STRA|nr:hypothetical protein JG687_00018727 [Phytophthora cactorum]